MTTPLLVLVLALSLTTGLSLDSPKADDGYEVFPAYPWSRYKIPPLRIYWQDALAFCENDAEGSTLLVINADAEAEVAKELVARLYGPTGSPSAWVGINDIAQEGVWRTVQGGLVFESGYNRWARGSPSAATAWNCGWIATEALYDDVPCASMQPFICEKPNV